MPGTERIDSIYNVAALQKEQAAVLAGLTASKKAIMDLYNSIQTFKTSNFGTLTQNTQQLTTATINANKATSSAIDLAKKEEELKQKKIRTSATQLRLDEQIRKEDARKAREAANLINQYKQLELTLRKQEIAYTNLAISQGRQSKAAREALASVTQTRATLNKLDADLGNHKRNVGNYTSAFSNMGRTFTNVLSAIGVTAGLSGLVAFFQSATDEAIQAQAATSKLRNILDNVGRSDAFPRIANQAKELAKQFKFLDNDDIIEVFQGLITYGKLTESQINDLLPVIINFSAKSGTSVQEASSVIIKALEGNSKSLKEYGINVKDGNSVTERMGIIMDELAPRVNGAADAFGKTFAGQLAIARQRMKDLQEEAGNNLIPILTKLLQLANTLLEKLNLIGSAAGQSIASIGANFFTNKKIEELGKQNDQEVTDLLAQGNAQTLKQKQDYLLKLDASIAGFEKQYREAGFAANKKQIDLLNTTIFIYGKARKQLADQIASETGGVLGLGDPDDDGGKAAKAQEDILSASLKSQIKLLQDFVDQGSVLYKERFDAAAQIAELEAELSESTLRKDIATGKSRQLAAIENGDRLYDIARNTQANIAKINKDKNLFADTLILPPAAEKAVENAYKRVNDDITKLIKAAVEDRMNIIATNQQVEEKNLNENYAAGLINRDEFEKGLRDISIKYSRETLQAQIQFSENQIKLLDPMSDAYRAMALEIVKAKNALAGLGTQDLTPLEALIEKIDEVAEVTSNLTAALSTINNIGYDNQKTKLEELNAEQERNYEQEVARINNSGLASEEKANMLIALEAKRQTQKTENDRRQRQADNAKARFDKAASIANIIVSTAAAVVKALPNIPLAISVGVLGAAQLAAAIATKVPQYKHGLSNDKPSHIGVYGEAGKELIMKPNEPAFIANKPTIDFLPKGTRIKPITGDMVDSIMNAQLIRSMAFFGASKTTDESLVVQKQMLKALKRRPTIKNNVTLDMKQSVWKFINIYRG